jgi:hypothetical protein
LVNESHPINSPGSSLRQSYPDYIIKFVEEWIWNLIKIMI